MSGFELDILENYSIEIALTGQLSTASCKSQSPHSSVTTCDFPFSILKTLLQRDSHVPHPMHKSSFTIGFDILFLIPLHLQISFVKIRKFKFIY